MKFEDLKLAYGFPLQLQAGATAQAERYSCRLIGCLPGRCILLSVPRASGKAIRFRPGQKLVARLMVGNGIGLFACTVESQSVDPIPLLQVSYPESVTFKGIRGATRVAVQVVVEVANLNAVTDTKVGGLIADISSSGARLEMKEAAGEIGDRICITGLVQILGIERTLILNAAIRSRVERSTQELSEQLPAIYGVEFIEKDEDRRVLLYAYVFSQIAKDERLA